MTVKDQEPVRLLSLAEQETLIKEEIQKFVKLGKEKTSMTVEEINELLPAEILAPSVLDAFMQALDFVIGHLQRLKKRYEYNMGCRKVVADAMEKFHTCLFFDQIIPWQENFFALDGKHHSALFVIMPAGEHWKLRGIPPDNEHRMQVRCPLPEAWAGLLEDQLKQVTGIPGAVFCHKGRFTSVWETKEAAVTALRLVLKLNNISSKDL